MEILFYPYDFEYKVEKKRVNIYLYGKLDSGEKICVIDQYQPYFYAKVDDFNKEVMEKRFQNLTLTGDDPAKVVSWEIAEKILLGKKQRFWKIFANYPKAVPLLARELQSWGIACYEKDFLFVHRYLRDKGIVPLTLVKAKGKFFKSSEFRVPLFLAESVKDTGKETLQKWRILALDIETYAKKREINPEKNPILMVGFYGIDEQGNIFQKVITWKKFKHKLDYLEIVADEVSLLRRCRDLIKEYQPEILAGYFSDGFDFPYLKTRARKHKISFNIGLDRSEPFIQKKQGFRQGQVKIKGLLHLDLFKFIRNIFGGNLETDSYSLNAVSEELLGFKKHEVNLDNLANIWDNDPDKLLDFCAYNLRDAHLTCELSQQLFSDIMEFTKLIGLPPFDIIRMRFSRLVENYILKRAMEYNVLAPNKPEGAEIEQRMDEHIQGAYVYEPTPGMYKDIVIFDFRSLYPTVITAHNLGPDGFRCSCCKNKSSVPEHDNYWFCQKEKNFLPKVLEHLVLRRVDLKRFIKEQREKGKDTKILEARSYALKILANSFYGYLGFFGARWYCLPCAASTTAYARDYIRKTIEKAKQRGFQVIYADTDSCFLLLGEKRQDQALEFMNSVNFDLPGHMELEFEGYFSRGIFVAIKKGGKGAKKKYALLREDGSIKITGFEMVRRNWSPLAKEVQKKVLRLVLEEKFEEAVTFVRNVVKDLKAGKVPLKKLILKTQITRELSQYTSISPHVLVAQKLSERGEIIRPGTIIEYVIGKGKGLVRDRARSTGEIKEGEYDLNYYLNNQLIPAVSSILAVFGYKEDDLSKESSQVGLGKFF